jgi:hypothetical protein
VSQPSETSQGAQGQQQQGQQGQQQSQGSSEAGEQGAPEGSGPPAGGSGPPATDQAQEGVSKTYDEKYVRELRDEAAGNRVRATKAQERLLAATLTTAGQSLADPKDLLVFTDTKDLLDEDGLPDPEKVSAAAEALAVSKPHLRRVVFTDVGQGPRGRPEEPKTSFTDMLRAAAN